MMTRTVSVLALMALLIPVGAAADKGTTNEAEGRDWLAYIAAGETTKDMLHRIEEAVGTLERQRNGRVQRLREVMSDEAWHLFEQERQAWEAFLAQHISTVSEIYEGGTIRGVVSGRTKIILLQERLVQLDRLIDHYEPH